MFRPFGFFTVYDGGAVKNVCFFELLGEKDVKNRLTFVQFACIMNVEMLIVRKESGMYIGIDIGGTKCAVTLGDLQCNIHKKIKFDTVGKDETLRKLTDAVAELTASCEIEAIGISCGGPLDSEKGIILSPPNLPGWDRVEIVSMLEERFGIKTYLQNDANACALAEWKFGAGKGCRHMAFLTFGTGLGAGLILGGRLYDGACGNAGEVGHIRLCEEGPVGFGKKGSFEGFCSGGGLAQLGKTKAMELLQSGQAPGFCPTLADLDRITAKSLAEAAEHGDGDALAVYRECGRYLGRGLSILIDILNPEVIVLGSIYARSGGLLEREMREVLEQECIGASLSACRILPAELGEEIGDVAALSVAINGKEEHDD